jgi:hypothetical protein
MDRPDRRVPPINADWIRLARKYRNILLEPLSRETPAPGRIIIRTILYG